MKKLVKKAGIVPVAALSLLSYLANPVDMNASDQKKKTIENRIYSYNPGYSATGEGVALKDFVFDLHLDENSNVNLEGAFGLYAKKGDIEYSVLDAKKGLRRIIDFLERDLNFRDAQSKKERIATINHYKNLFDKISESDAISVNSLEKAVRDGVIDVRGDSLVAPEGWKIKGGMYVFVAKSKTIDGKSEKYVANSIPFVVDLKISPEKIHPERAGIDPKLIGGPIRLIPTLPEDIRKKIEEDLAREKGIPYEEYAKPVRKDERKFASTGLILDVFAGKDGLKGAGVGFKYGPVAFLVNASKSNDLRINEVTVPLSLDRYGYGTEDHIDFNSLGLAGELHPIEYFFLGVGGNRWNYTEKINENIFSGEDEVIKSNTNSQLAKEYSLRGYAGVEIPIRNAVGIRVSGGYDTKKGIYGGIGLNVKLNKKPHQRRK